MIRPIPSVKYNDFGNLTYAAIAAPTSPLWEVAPVAAKQFGVFRVRLNHSGRDAEGKLQYRVRVTKEKHPLPETISGFVTTEIEKAIAEYERLVDEYHSLWCEQYRKKK